MVATDKGPIYGLNKTKLWFEFTVFLYLNWGMQSTSSLPSLPGPLGPGMVATDKGPIYGLNKTKLWFEFTVFCI